MGHTKAEKVGEDGGYEGEKRLESGIFAMGKSYERVELNYNGQVLQKHNGGVCTMKAWRDYHTSNYNTTGPRSQLDPGLESGDARKQRVRFTSALEALYAVPLLNQKSGGIFAADETHTNVDLQ